MQPLQPLHRASPDASRDASRVAPARERPRDQFAHILADAELAEPAPASPAGLLGASRELVLESMPQSALPDLPALTGLPPSDLLAPALSALPFAAPVPPLQTPLVLSPTSSPPPTTPALPSDIHVRLRAAPLPPLVPARHRLDKPPVSATPAAATAGEPSREPGFIPVLIEAERTDELPELVLGTAEGRTLQVPELVEVQPARISEVPELTAPMPQQLNLEIQDSQGRWELDVLRSGEQIHIEVAGDAEIKQILHGSVRELEQRLGMHGDMLGSVHWRPITASHSTQNDRMESGDHQAKNQGGQPDARQQQARPQPQAPADNPAESSRRGLLHRII